MMQGERTLAGRYDIGRRIGRGGMAEVYLGTDERLGRRVVGQEDLLSGKLGRIREVASGPDGYLYFTTSNRDRRGTPAADDDRIFRIKPASADAGRKPEQ